MFASVRKYKVRRGSVEHLAQRVQDGFVPLVRQMDGFRSYYLLDGGPDVLITISIFDSSDAAFASNETAANWVRHNVLEFTRGMPEVMVGNALVAEVEVKRSASQIEGAAPSREAALLITKANHRPTVAPTPAVLPHGRSLVVVADHRPTGVLSWHKMGRY